MAHKSSIEYEGTIRHSNHDQAPGTCLQAPGIFFMMNRKKNVQQHHESVLAKAHRFCRGTAGGITVGELAPFG